MYLINQQTLKRNVQNEIGNFFVSLLRYYPECHDEFEIDSGSEKKTRGSEIKTIN